MDEPQLDYAIATEPWPLQASPSGGGGFPAKLLLVASNPDEATSVEVVKIGIYVPCGTAARHLVTTEDVAQIVATPPAGWTATPKPPATFGFDPPGGHAEIQDDGLAFVLDEIVVNTVPGVAKIAILEARADGAGELWIPVPKFPSGLASG